MIVARMLAGRGVAPRAYVADRQRRDGPPEHVVRGEHTWPLSSRLEVPMLTRWRDQIRDSVEELKR